MAASWQRPRKQWMDNIKIILREVNCKDGRWISSYPVVLAALNFQVAFYLRCEYVGQVQLAQICPVVTLCAHHYVNLQLSKSK